MRIALIRRGYSPTGGAEAYLKRFARALRQAGHEALLFTTVDWPQEPEIFSQILGVGAAAALPPIEFASIIEGLDLEADLSFSLERLYECDCFRAGDGVHAAWLQRRAAVDPWWKAWFRQNQRKHRQILELEQSLFAKERAGQVIANSHLVAREITEHYGYPAERLHVVYNGVPPPLPEAAITQARQHVRAELDLAEDDYVILFAGSGWERKGLRYAMAAVEQVPGATLLVAGSGKRRGLPASPRIRFLGPVPGLGSTLAAADSFVLPTLYDPFSNACLEALAAGLPVITTQANGVAEILDAADGTVIANPANLEALSEAMRSWRDPAHRAATRAGRQSKAAAFTMERNVAETLRILLPAGG